MIKRWLSNFIRNNKDKIKDLGTKLLIVAVIILIATIILSSNNKSDNQEDTFYDVYKPTETVIKGSDVSKEQYKNDSNIVEKFLECCNKKEIEKAYEMLSDECKEKEYPSIEKFKQQYYEYIFEKERNYNLQSWISTTEYTVYKVRYTANILETGEYQSNDVYQDYITLIKNNNEEKISIGSFITSEDLNKETSTEELYAKVIKKYIYIEDEEYEMYVRNNTENTIKLDSLESSDNIKLIGDKGGAYNIYKNKLFSSDLTITPGETKKITLRFKKPTSSNNKSKYINFFKVIRNHTEYLNNTENYKDVYNFKILL